MHRITRHIKEGFVGILRHGAMSLSSVTAVTLTLLLVSMFLLLTLNLQQITKNVENSVQIHVKINEDVTDMNTILEMEAQITKIIGVTAITYSDKNQELDSFILAFGEDGKIFEMYRGDSNPLRNAFLVDVARGADLPLVSDIIGKMPGVESANYGGENTIKLVSMLNTIRNGGLILVSFLSFLAIFLIANTIKITIYSRNTEITIMRTIGASNNFIRAPYLIEGVIIGLLGSILPVIVTVVGYMYIYKSMGGVLVSNLFTLHAVFPFVYQISGILVSIAVLVGLFGSFISVTRYLRWSR